MFRRSLYEFSNPSLLLTVLRMVSHTWLDSNPCLTRYHCASLSSAPLLSYYFLCVFRQNIFAFIIPGAFLLFLITWPRSLLYRICKINVILWLLNVSKHVFSRESYERQGSFGVRRMSLCCSFKLYYQSIIFNIAAAEATV